MYSLLAVTLWFSSCVPVKQLAYLQDEDLKTQKEIQVDSITNTYPDIYNQYTLRPGDIVSVKVGSVTPSDYDFIKQYTEQLGIIRKLNQYNQDLRLFGGVQGGGMFMGGGGGGNQQVGGNDLMMLTGFEIMNDGKMDLPYLGEIVTAGKTLVEVEEEVEAALEKGFMESPIVRTQLMSFHFTILGEANNEGRHTSYDTKTHFFDAITMAGNLTEFADRSHIKVVRTINGNREIFYINLLDEKFLNSPFMYLYPNDLIVVAPLPARTFNMYGRQNTQFGLSIVSTTLALFAIILSLSSNN